MTNIISVKKWARPMKTLDEGTNTPNLILPHKLSKSMKIDDIEPISITDSQSECTSQPIFDLRRAAECHKIVRRNIQDYIKPGVSILEICNRIERNVKELFGRNDSKAGSAFPTGVSINEIICHDTANSGDVRTIGYNDICKVDFGTHVNGMIIDSAFSVAFNPEYEKLLEASYEATWTGIKMAGPDSSIYDISSAIKEVIESYEVTIKGKTYHVKPVGDIGGHSIEPYQIHGAQIILCEPLKTTEYKESRMIGGKQYAIETFASTGTGKMFKSKTLQSNHYMLNKDNPVQYKSKLKTINTAYNWVKRCRSTLAFCPRWMENDGVKGTMISLNEMARKQNPPIVTEYCVLEDIPGSYVSHYEHTIFIHDFGTEVLSHGDDY